MKKILVIFSIVSFIFFSCSSQYPKVKAIAMIDILWDDEYTMVISNNKENLESSINKKRYMPTLKRLINL
jgi:hypothetical protein